MCVYRELEGGYFAMRLALFGERDMQGDFSNDVYGGEDTLLGAGTKNLHFCCICGAGMHGWGAG